MPYEDDFWSDPGVAPPAYGGGGSGMGAGGRYQGLGDFGGDPMAYSQGSWYTPWTQQFNAPPEAGGGGGGIAIDPFSYGDFSYDYRAPGAYTDYKEMTPDYFGYGEFQSPAAFKAPTERDLRQDPSYQFRVKQGQDALQAQAASRGLARTGGFAKAMTDYGQQAASQEYGNVYGRKAAEYDRAAQLARQDWATRRGNAFEQNQANYGRRAEATQANNANRLAAYNANVDASIRGQQLGYDIGTGTYDRNRQNALDAYNSRMAIAQSNASAGSANANRAYDRALDEYKMAYDIYQNNQSNQFNRTAQMMQLGMRGAENQGGYGADYGANQGSVYGQQANARAAGRQGSADAWAQGLGGAADAAMDYYAMSQGFQPTGGRGGRGGSGVYGAGGARLPGEVPISSLPRPR